MLYSSPKLSIFIMGNSELWRDKSEVYRNHKLEWLILKAIDESGGKINKRLLRAKVEKAYERRHRSRLSQSIFSRVLKTMKHLALASESVDGTITWDCFFCMGRPLYNTVLTLSYLIGASPPSNDLIDKPTIYNPLKPYYKGIVVEHEQESPSLESLSFESTKQSSSNIDQPIITRFLDSISIHVMMTFKNKLSRIGHIKRIDKTVTETSDHKSALGSREIIELFENEKINTFPNLPQSALMEDIDAFKSHNIVQIPISLANVILLTRKAYDELVKGNLKKIEIYMPNGCGAARHNIGRLLEPKGVKCEEIRLSELHRVREIMEYKEVGIITESMFFTAELIRRYDIIPILYLEPQYLVTDGDLHTRKVELIERHIERDLSFDALSIYTSFTSLLSKESSELVDSIKLEYESYPAFLPAYNKFVGWSNSFWGE